MIFKTDHFLNRFLHFKTRIHHLLLQRCFSLNAKIENEQFLIVIDNDEHIMKFPNIWLRDNCQCSSCFHLQTSARIVNWDSYDKVSTKISKIRTIEANNSVAIEWNDKHKSIFGLNWLKEREFSSTNQKRYIQKIYQPPMEFWNKKKFFSILKTFDYYAILNNDKDLLKWLNSLAVYGCAIIKNAPDDFEVVRNLANRIGFIKRTTYGEEFEVTSKKDAKNYAYHMTPLPLHTDMPYYHYKAGVNILHFMVQTQFEGGASLISDGFHVADQLRQHFPDYFDILRNTPVNWFDVGKDGVMKFNNIYRSPIICLDIDGNYQRINLNTTKRDSHFTVSIDRVIPWYEAYDKFLQYAYSEAVECKTSAGDVLTFNNLRTLHGRTAFEDSEYNKRHLIGAYIDWDIIYSKIRVLSTNS